MQRYIPSEIEPKWQKIWDEQQTYKADLNSDKPKYIAMSMFNYPSGAGIHIGHAMNYTISDVMARFKRQQGYESYHPVGWDAFGLPAENYAIKSGVSPQASMSKIIPDYHRQYKAMGWSNDWSKEISTHLPEYYKWTQWIFCQIYKAGLAYQDARMQWWCTKCQTVLADEQVIDGKCWRHDSADDLMVEKKEVKQWFFKITDYADELLEATSALDWSEVVKTAQKNWIGKSKGAEIIFAVESQQPLVDSSLQIKVFTTRPDTIFGATFLVLAPEHELVGQLTVESEKQKVESYIEEVLRKTEVERQTDKEKSGVFTGSYAINPASGEKVPIWIAEYVLTGYGTGAIMAVPAHDERDYDFAKKFNIPIIDVVEKPEDSEELYSGEGKLINSGEFDGMGSAEAREKITAKFGTEKINYKMRDWSVSRQRYWGAPIPIIHCDKCGIVLVEDENLPVVLPELEDFAPSGDGRSALARATSWLKVTCPKCSGQAERETDTLDTYICSSWYFLRYFDPDNSSQPFDKLRASRWMPIDFYNGGDHATAHMLYARFVTRFFHKAGLLQNPEPFKKFLFNGKVTAADGSNFSKSKGNGVDPLEIIGQGYGADALRTYLMFAAPLDLWMRWDPQGVPGTYRFLNRIWTLVQEYLEQAGSGEREVAREEAESQLSDHGSETRPLPPTHSPLLKFAHRTIKKVTHDLEHQKYNTAIAAMMKMTNDLYEEKAKNGFVDHDGWKLALESITQLVAPFAPHTAEELWQQLGHQDSINKDHWPLWDEVLVAEDTVTIAVQINGKVRAELDVAADISEEDVIELAKSNEKVQSLIAGKEIRKAIYVRGRLVSLVV